jgi:hypothetical protein
MGPAAGPAPLPASLVIATCQQIGKMAIPCLLHQDINNLSSYEQLYASATNYLLTNPSSALNM